MSDQTPLPNLSTDKDFDGESFAPVYTTTVTVSGGQPVTGGPRGGHARTWRSELSQPHTSPGHTAGREEKKMTYVIAQPCVDIKD